MTTHILRKDKAVTGTATAGSRPGASASAVAIGMMAGPVTLHQPLTQGRRPAGTDHTD